MPRGVPNTPKTDTDTAAPPTARPPVRRPISDAMAAFRERAASQAERLPSVTIRIDEGQFLSGKVRKVGRAFHAYGDSPVVEFLPGTWETDTPVTYSADEGGGMLIEDVPEDHSAVFVGVGTVADQLRDARPGDLLYIARHTDGVNPAGRPYVNLEFLCERDGVMMALRDHVEREQRAAAGKVQTAFPGTTEVPTEEPF